jgi:hypothetical protein
VKKHLVLIILIVVAVILAVAGVILLNSGKILPQAASNGATLALSPSSGSVNSGSTISLDVMVNTGGLTIDGVDLVNLNYPADKLELQKITQGANFQVTPVKQSGGVISLVATVPPGSSGYNGNSNVATLAFKALALGTANLTFDFTLSSTRDCNVAEHGTGKDILTEVFNGTYSIIAAGATPAPTPTPKPGGTTSPSSSTTSSKTKTTTAKSSPSPASSSTLAPEETLSITPTPAPEATVMVGGYTASMTVGYILYFLIPILFLLDLYLIWKKLRTKPLRKDNDQI